MSPVINEYTAKETDNKQKILRAKSGTIGHPLHNFPETILSNFELDEDFLSCRQTKCEMRGPG